MKQVVHGNAMGSFLFLQCRANCALSYPLKVCIILRFGCFLSQQSSVLLLLLLLLSSLS